jgi:hypothetical protein
MMSLAPGTYTLSFDLIGSQRGLTTSTTVTLGSLFNQTFILGSSDLTDGIVNDTITVAAPTTALIFTSDTPGNIGALLDSVNFAAASVATPPSLPLCLCWAWLGGLDGSAPSRYFQVTPSSSTGITPGNLQPHSR